MRSRDLSSNGRNGLPPGHATRELNRAEFLRIAITFGGLAAFASLLEACGLPVSPELTPASTHPPSIVPTWTPGMTPTGSPTLTPQPAATLVPTPSPTSGKERALVALVKTHQREQGVQQALDLLGVNPVRGKNLFLKPNFNSADPPPGSTHNETLAAIVRHLRTMGAQQITVGDRSGMGDTRAVMQQKGIFRMAEELGFEVQVFDELDSEGWERLQITNGHWSQGFAVARPLIQADGIVQTCCLKTHRFGGHFTLSLKNSVGMVARRIPGERHDYMDELHRSGHQRTMIAEINAAYQPDFVLLDGIEAFVDGGPDRGTLVSPGVILAGTDRVAVDAIGVAVLRSFGTTAEVSRGPIFQLEQISRAAELGIGVQAADQIELVTDDPESATYARRLEELLLGS